MCTRISIANLGCLVGVHPNLALAGFEDTRGKTSLKSQVRPIRGWIRKEKGRTSAYMFFEKFCDWCQGAGETINYNC